MPHHRLEEYLHPVDVVVEVEQRLFHALADKRICREMNDRLDLILRENLVEQRSVANIALVKFRRRVQCAAMPRLQIIDNDDLLALFNERVHRMGANVARTAANQDSHEYAPFTLQAACAVRNIRHIEARCIADLRRIRLCNILLE